MPLPQQANLRDYWRIILKRKKPFVFIFTIIMVGALFLTKETKTEERFVATAKIAVEGAFVQVDALPGSGVVRRDPWVVLNPAFLQTQFGILKSQIVAERAIKILGWDMQNKEMLITKIKQQIAINQPGSEDTGGDRGSIISISATDTNPREAMEIANRFAPEHLELMVEHPREILDNVRHAGAVFLGYASPEAMGDYVAGPNHILPTGGTARFASPLSVYDFIKRTSVLSFSPDSLARLGEQAARFARLEGLGGHEKSVLLRLEKK